MTRQLRPTPGSDRSDGTRLNGHAGGSTTAAGRVLAVLDAFGPAHASLTLSEISRRSGLSLTTTHRLVGELKAWGALERGADGRYGIGLRLLELGALAPQGLQLREVALPYVDDLHQATRANVVLGVRDGADVIYVEALRARGAVRLMSRIGGRWPLHATGTGQVLLAHADQEVQEEVLSGPLKAFTPHTITDPAALRRTLAQVRRTGVAVAENQLTADAPALAVAVPVRGAGDEVVAALGVTVSAGTTPPQALVPVLNATARGISRALGSPSAQPAARPRQ